MSIFVDLLWEEKQIPCLLPKNITDKIQTWLSARAVQCAGKQASGIVRGTRKKHSQRLWRINELKKTGDSASRLEKITAREKPSKPNLQNISAELDERFVTTKFGHNSFDGWITLTSLSNRMSKRNLKIILPFRMHKHFNKLTNLGAMSEGVRIREKDATFIFKWETPVKTRGDILGVDVGVTNVLSTSDGVLSQPCNGHSMASITKRLARKKKGSNGFRQASNHRKNFVNWSINQLNLHNVREVRRENIKNLRRGKRTSRLLSHWTYADIFGKLDRLCEERGVLVSLVNPAYTSQICSRCGTLGNRRGKSFSCICGNVDDADINAALNLKGEPIVRHENVFQ